MLNEAPAIIENAKKSKLLALFNVLEERDKDIVITMTESLVEQYKNNEMKFEGVK
jgi:Tfp pilus assembly pilus retraction ATPase PilT